MTYLFRQGQGRMQTMQNKIVKYMLNGPTKTHIGYEQFKQVDLLPVENRVEQLKLGHMYSIINNSAPDYIQTDVKMVRNHHRHGTRASDMSCVVPRVKGYGKASLLYTGICLWDNLPLSVQQCRTKSMFKNHIKKFLWDKIDAVHQNVYMDRF